MDPVTIAAIGSAAGGIGSLLGGLGVGKKKADPAFQIALQEQSALRHEKASFDQKMELAKTHGLHPLAVLGVPMSTFAPAIPQDTGGGVDFSAIGSGVERIAQSTIKPPEQPDPDPIQSRLLDAQVRTAEATAKKAEWDALGAEWRTQGILGGQPGNPPALRVSNDSVGMMSLAAAQAGVSPRTLAGSGVKLEQTVAPPHPSLLGHSLAADQGFQRLVDSDGQLISIPNPNVYNPDIEQFGTFHYLSNKYGVDRAMTIMAALENAPLAGGILGGIGYAGAKAYQYFARQRAEALRRRTTRQSFSRPGPMRSVGPRNE